MGGDTIGSGGTNTPTFEKWGGQRGTEVGGTEGDKWGRQGGTVWYASMMINQSFQCGQFSNLCIRSKCQYLSRFLIVQVFQFRQLFTFARDKRVTIFRLRRAFIAKSRRRPNFVILLSHTETVKLSTLKYWSDESFVTLVFQCRQFCRLQPKTKIKKQETLKTNSLLFLDFHPGFRP